MIKFKIKNIRKIHRQVSIIAAAFILITAITGLLLGWKNIGKNSLLPKTQQGTSTDFKTWLSIDSLSNIAIKTYCDYHKISNCEIDRIDVRKRNGVVKFSFKNSNTGIQIDGVTGEVLSIETRYSDIVENIHDGSIIDKLLNNKNQLFKYIFTTIVGLSLLFSVVTGVWIWLYSKRKKK